MSTSLKVVSIAVVFFASTSLRLIVLRRLLIFSAFSSRPKSSLPTALPGFVRASRTSCFIIRPLDPEGVTFFTSTFLSAKIAAATGVAFTSLERTGIDFSSSVFTALFPDVSFGADLGSSFFSDLFFGSGILRAEAGFSAVSSIVETISPIFNVSFSLATVCKILLFQH